MKPDRLRAGDKVHLVSPASTPAEDSLRSTVGYLESLDLRVQVGAHALARNGYMAGTDEERLADLNHALRDPEAKAVIATRGGKGAYRIADQMDFKALAEHPKLIIGFSEITILQLAALKHCGIASIHGAAWSPEFDPESSASFERAVFTSDPITIATRTSEPTHALTTRGQASGMLIGGNQDMIATAEGWALPNLDGAILLLEDVDKRLGHIDRQLTRLRKMGVLDQVAGIAIGQYESCGPDATTQGSWSTIDVLRLNLEPLAIPILGGLPLGHGASPRAAPIGTHAQLDAESGTLTVVSPVR